MILALLACAGGGADTAKGEDSAPVCETATTWDNFADGFFASYCRSCHSADTPERYGAPEGLDFDTEAQVRGFEAAVRSVVFYTESMPPGGGLLADDLILLGEWLDCGGSRGEAGSRGSRPRPEARRRGDAVPPGASVAPLPSG